MKDQILKIAGVKSEKEFYKKYPTEESFMAKHGKKLEKLAMGKAMVKKQLTQLTDFSNPPIAQDGAAPKFEFTNNVKADGLGATAGAAGMGLIQGLGKIVGGINAIGEQKKNIKKAQMAQTVSGLGLEAAAGQRRNQPKRQYVRPEDALVQPDQLGPAQGTGTNFLQMESGGEIQNTYAPGTLYDDLGYEPLKQYQEGGQIPTAEFGEYFQDSGQAQIGSVAGEALGTAFFGPAGGAVGKLVGQVAGNLLGGAKQARQLKSAQDATLLNQQQTAMQSTMQNQFGAYMEKGGWVSHDWQPQKITKFGDYDVKDLLKPDPMMNTLRSGGHLAQVNYTPPSAEAMFTGRRDVPYNMEDGGYMAMGGALQTHWGGDAELMSYNPYIPGGGETVMFRGQSHDDTNGKGQSGIGITYGDNPVEVERGEPMTEMNDGGVVYGNMKISDFSANEIGDPEAEGMKYKNYVADLSKTEAKQNKILDKSSELALNANPNNIFDQLTLNSSKANMLGANMKLKDIADKKMNAAAVQSAILDTADELGLVADDLAQGKIKQAKFGGKMTAQDGTSLSSFLKTPFAERKKLAKQLGYTDYSGKNEAQQKKLYDLFKNNSKVYNPPTPVNLVDNTGPNYNWMVNSTPFPRPVSQTAAAAAPEEEFHPPSIEDMPGTILSKKDGKLKNILKKTGKVFEDYGPSLLSNLTPYLRPTDQEPLDPAQLMGEQYALAMNQLEPVQAQKYQPQLGGVMDVSYQDQLNEITAQARASERMMQNNPEAAANLFAQVAQAKNKVLAEQTRANMLGRKQVYDENRNLLNQAQLQNLQILDQQYVRQAQAKSATKAQAQAALNSIADKIAKNKLENRQLGIYENLYNYRFDPKGRALNMNALAQFNIPQNIGPDDLTDDQKKLVKQLNEKIVTRDKTGAVTESKEKTRQTTVGRNGSIVKAIKNL